MANTTDQLIQQNKDELENRLTDLDPMNAKILAETLETLVNVKRLEQFIEQESDK